MSRKKAPRNLDRLPVDKLHALITRDITPNTLLDLSAEEVDAVQRQFSNCLTTLSQLRYVNNRVTKEKNNSLLPGKTTLAQGRDKEFHAAIARGFYRTLFKTVTRINDLNLRIALDRLKTVYLTEITEALITSSTNRSPDNSFARAQHIVDQKTPPSRRGYNRA